MTDDDGGREGGREEGRGGREGGRGGREGGRGGREGGEGGREGRDDRYTYSNIIQWRHSILITITSRIT